MVLEWSGVWSCAIRWLVLSRGIIVILIRFSRYSFYCFSVIYCFSVVYCFLLFHCFFSIFIGTHLPFRFWYPRSLVLYCPAHTSSTSNHSPYTTTYSPYLHHHNSSKRRNQEKTEKKERDEPFSIIDRRSSISFLDECHNRSFFRLEPTSR
ncbi:hypothetical protein L873DRAFT_739672 [Choiromyces venosus 120613-1]|uniref:Uncharacterized protein n=1 Tax=Choiromyces venosus 120613-1 TaxID=1336337 RepID=A0A3N4JR12_9PEZI|nr:hypothetical protein L873DRAFT_739672 [Choiromyces venosus 120613-1]